MTQPPRARPDPVDRACLVAAFALTFAWFLVFDHFRPDYLVDESGHLGNVYHFLEGKPGWPVQMTMLPGYHFLVAALWQLHPPLRLLTLSRLVSSAGALLGLAAFALAWTRLHSRPAGRATLLLALLPILQPFTGMAYTDTPALAFVLLAIGAQFAGRFGVAALAFVVAAALRQTTLVWAGFLIVAEFVRPGGSLREFFPRVRWLALLLGLAAGVLLAAGRLSPGTQTGNAVQPNPATLHFAGLLVLLLGLPVWLAHGPAAFRAWREPLRARRPLAFGATALALFAAAGLALTFHNPHVWNREFFWDEGKFTLLRNWPLIYLDRHPWLRLASGLNLVLMAAALTLAFTRQPRRPLLWIALAFGALMPAVNSLVEPRYFIEGAAVLLLLLELAPRDQWLLTGWWALLCVVHAPFVARGVSLW